MPLKPEPTDNVPLDITELLLTGQHPVLRVGTSLDALRPFLLWSSAGTHPNGTPLGGDVALDGLRFCIGLDESACLSYWVMKRSLQDRSLRFSTTSGAVDLAEIDAFGFLRLLEEARIPYAREIWRNSVCIITVLQSSVTVSFDLEPAVARAFASIELGTAPLFLGGDVLRRTDYN